MQHESTTRGQPWAYADLIVAPVNYAANQPWPAKPPRFIASGLPANGLVLSDMAGTPSDMAGMRSIEHCVSAPSYPPKALLMYDVAEIKILLQCLTRDAVRVKWSSPLKYKVNYPFFPINLSLG